MTKKRFIYTFKNDTMVIIDKKDNVLIRDKYRACDYLNRLNNENKQLKERNKRQYNQLTELWDLIEEENWEILIEMVKQMKEEDKQLQKMGA